jgi:hypothetical protein
MIDKTNSPSAVLPTIRIGPGWNRPVEPEKRAVSSRSTPSRSPRRDLPKDFQESVQMGWKDYLIYNTMFDYDFATAIRPARDIPTTISRANNSCEPNWRICTATESPTRVPLPEPNGSWTIQSVSEKCWR